MLTILCGDALEQLKLLPNESVQCCVTSPPYWGLRDYGTARWEGGDESCEHEGNERYYTERTAAVSSEGAFSEAGEANVERLKQGRWRNNGTCVKCGAVKIDTQLGLEKTPEEYVGKMVEIFAEVRRVLRKDGTVWLNLGDSYAGAPVGSFNGGGFKDKSAQTGGRDLSGVETSGRMDKLKSSGLKPKDLIGIPWRVAFALQSDGWWLRSDIIWNKANCMPESVLDRPTRSHEYLFLLSKSARYYYDAEAIKEPAIEHDWENRIGRSNLNHKLIPDEMMNGIRPDVKYTLNAKQRMDSEGHPLFKNAEDYAGKNGLEKPRKNKQRDHSRRHDGFNDRWDQMEKTEQCSGMRNKRDVWTVAPANYPEAHFATFPPDLIKPCVLAGTKAGDMVLDPFAGSGTTGEVSIELGRKVTLIELNPKYIELIRQRCDVTPGLALA